MNTPFVVFVNRSADARKFRRRAFTLIELLTVIAIVAILSGILLAVVGRVREGARSATCLSNLRQLGMAFQLYRDDNRGKAPRTYTDVGALYWYHQLLGTATGVAGSKYMDGGRVPVCPSHDLTGHVPAGGYGMSNFSLWYPAPLHRVDDVPLFYATRLQRPSDWPLFMDADGPIIYGLDNPIQTAATAGRFSARHGDAANVLMADYHVEKARYGDARWHQNVLNSGSYYTR